MAQIPWTEIVRELGDAIEHEIDAAKKLAKRAALVETVRDANGLRVAIELRTKVFEAPLDQHSADLEQLRSEREVALQSLAEALSDRAQAEHRLTASEEARKGAEAALRRLKARVKELEGAARHSEAPADEAAVEQLRAELGREQVARAAVEATLAFAEREREELLSQLQEERGLREESLAELMEARQLANDLQAELTELWRAMRETRPGEPLSINLSVSEPVRRAGIERVQAKIVDARELFKRRSGHRWPIAI